MLLGVIADDFTGASDIANTLARGGLMTTQYLGIPAEAAASSCEAGVVALKTRSIPAADAVAQSLAALSWLKAQGCQQFVFKYCSTFDSTPQGNIGPVGEALAKALEVSGVVACPAFPKTGRTVFQGHLFVGDRLLSDSSLRDHPLNPMTDPDLRRWLRQQTEDPVGLVTHAVVARGADALGEALNECAGRGERLVIVDAVDEGDLYTIGEACAGIPLVTGASGIALGLPANFVGQGLAQGGRARSTGIDGPEAILAGSCSARTLQQVQRHLSAHPCLVIQTEDVMEAQVAPQDAVDFVMEHQGRQPLVFSTAAPPVVAAAQEKYGREKVAQTLEDFFAQAACELVGRGVRRMVVAGGETSGAVVTALGLHSLEIGPEIDPGVPVLFSRTGDGLALALKSGNFGDVDFFSRALALMQNP